MSEMERDTRQEEMGISFLDFDRLRAEIRNEAIEECTRALTDLFNSSTIGATETLVLQTIRALKADQKLIEHIQEALDTE